MVKNLYLITGNDALEKELALSKIQEDFGEKVKGINYIVIEKESINTLESEINTYAFGYPSKFILVKIDVKEKKKKTDKDDSSSEEIKEQEEQEDEIEWFNDELEQSLLNMTDVTVVFYGDFSKRSKVYKFLEKQAKCMVCDNKSEYDLLTWCAKSFKENGIAIANEDIKYLISLCGKDKLTLNNEMEKLISYSFDKKTINQEDIDKLCIKTSDTIIFALTDSVAQKKSKAALNILDELLENKEPIQKIVIMIGKHFHTLLVVKKADLENKNISEVLPGRNPGVCTKYKNQARLFTFDELKEKIRSIAELDVQNKTGQMDLKIGLEKIIIS